MGVKALYTNIPNNKGIAAVKRNTTTTQKKHSHKSDNYILTTF